MASEPNGRVTGVHGARSARRPSSLTWRAPGVPSGPPPEDLRSARSPVPAQPRPPTGRDPMTDVTDTPTTPTADDAASPPPRQPAPSFSDFPIHADIVDALAEHDITSPFPIQAMTLPVALSGHDIIGQAKTGTGKTLGFGIPILNRVVSPRDEAFSSMPAAGKPQALAVAPTRELAVQVAGDLERAGRKRGIRVLTVYGGRAYEPQIEALQRGVEVVVGTPGRLIDLAKQGHLDLGHARIVVLDEADEMLGPRLPPRRREAAVADSRGPPDDALLGDDAGRRRRAGAPLHEPAHPHPGDGRRPGERAHRQGGRAVRLPRPRHGQGRDARAHAPGPRARADDHLQPHQAHRRQGGRRPRRARASPPRRSTATSARAPASRRCARSATARSTSSSPPTSRPAASTSSTSPTSSTTSAPRTRRPTCTASGAPPAPATPASR